MKNLMTLLFFLASASVYAELVSVNSNHGQIRQIAASGDGTLFGLDAYGNIFLTRNLGKTWDKYTEKQQLITSISASFAGEVYASIKTSGSSGSSEIDKTTDGKQWTNLSGWNNEEPVTAPSGETFSSRYLRRMDAHMDDNYSIPDGIDRLKASSNRHFCGISTKNPNRRYDQVESGIWCVKLNSQETKVQVESTSFYPGYFQATGLSIDGSQVYGVGIDGVVSEVNLSADQTKTISNPISAPGEFYYDLTTGPYNRLYALKWDYAPIFENRVSFFLRREKGEIEEGNSIQLKSTDGFQNKIGYDLDIESCTDNLEAENKRIIFSCKLSASGKRFPIKITLNYLSGNRFHYEISKPPGITLDLGSDFFQGDATLSLLPL